MSDKLMPYNGNIIPINAGTDLPTHIANQQAEKIVNAKQISNLNLSIQMVGALPGMPGYEAAPQFIPFTHDYYNLVVYASEPFQMSGHILFQKNRCLMEKETIEPDIKKKYSPLADEAIAEILTFPTIFANENTYEENQFAYFGQITDVKNQNNGIKLYYRMLAAIPQMRLLEILFNLDIKGNYKCNELGRTHWTIKRIDLIEELEDAGIHVPY